MALDFDRKLFQRKGQQPSKNKSATRTSYQASQEWLALERQRTSDPFDNYNVQRLLRTWTLNPYLARSSEQSRPVFGNVIYAKDFRDQPLIFVRTTSAIRQNSTSTSSSSRSSASALPSNYFAAATKRVTTKSSVPKTDATESKTKARCSPISQKAIESSNWLVCR